jgi:Flp pilus assembly protein TadD
MNDPEVLLEQGNALFVNGRFAEAKTCYRRVHALQSGRAETANNLGVALAEQGRLDEFRNARRRHPSKLLHPLDEPTGVAECFVAARF